MRGDRVRRDKALHVGERHALVRRAIVAGDAPLGLVDHLDQHVLGARERREQRLERAVDIRLRRVRVGDERGLGRRRALALAHVERPKAELDDDRVRRSDRHEVLQVGELVGTFRC